MQTELGSKTRISLPPDPAELIHDRRHECNARKTSGVLYPTEEILLPKEMNSLTESTVFAPTESAGSAAP